VQAPVLVETPRGLGVSARSSPAQLLVSWASRWHRGL